jgi:hypothetical protein
MPTVSRFSIYTMLHSSKLRDQAARGAQGELTERKAWVTAERLWHEALKAGEACH